MNKSAMKPNICFFKSIPLKKVILKKRKEKIQKLGPNFFFANAILKLMVPVFLNTLTFNHFIIKNDFFLVKLDNAAKKKAFLYLKKSLFAMKIGNQDDKQVTPSESWDQDGFVEPWFGVSSNSNHEASIFTTLWPPNQGEYLDRLICPERESWVQII